MISNKLVVLGSVNADHVIQTDSLPRPGETVSGSNYQVIPGGKGANQAVACARLGGKTSFIACVGEDSFGRETRRHLADMGMDVTGIETIASKATGVALITVDSKAENSIAIAPEANACLDQDYVTRHQDLITQGDLLLMQLETPLAGLLTAAEIARAANIRVVLNPAPAKVLPKELLANVSIITPNQTEAEVLTGIPVHDQTSARQASKALHTMGIETVVITMGKSGAWISQRSDESLSKLVFGYQVKPVDTTAAGDTFNGALVVALSEGRSLEQAAMFANAAGALSVTRPGAQPSVPDRHEVESFLNSQR